MLLDFLILFHVILMTYWLGSDIGVFYASKYASRSDLSVETRQIVRKIMHWIDLLPRMCMVLMLPSGISLMAAHPRGQDVFPLAFVIGIWVLSLIWLAAVIYQYRVSGSGDTSTRQFQILTKTDFNFRIVLVVILVGSGLYTMFADQPFGVEGTNPSWLGAKVALYGLTVACGVGIRVVIKQGAPLLQRSLTEGNTPELQAMLQKNQQKSLLFVYAIWALIVVIAFLGISQPGA